MDMISERFSTDLKELGSAVMKFWIDCWSFWIIVLKIVGFRWCSQSGPSSSPEIHPKFARESPETHPQNEPLKFTPIITLRSLYTQYNIQSEFH